MIKRYLFVGVLSSLFLLIGCINRFESPKLEFIGLGHSHLQDTILFKGKPYPFYVLRFSSNKEIEKSGYDYPNLLLYASAQKRDFSFHDVRSTDTREGEVFSTISIKKVDEKSGKYYYAAALYPTISKEELKSVNDTVYCKIFYVRMFQSIPQTEEMKIPKDSLYVLFE